MLKGGDTMSNKHNVVNLNKVGKCFLSGSGCQNLCYESLMWAEKLLMWKSALRLIFYNDVNLNAQDWQELDTVITFVFSSVSIITKAIGMHGPSTNLGKRAFSVQQAKKESIKTTLNADKGVLVSEVLNDAEKSKDAKTNNELGDKQLRGWRKGDRMASGMFFQGFRPGNFCERQRRPFFAGNSNSDWPRFNYKSNNVVWIMKKNDDEKKDDTTKQGDKKK